MLTVQHLSGQLQGMNLFQSLGFTLLPGSLVRLEGMNGIGKTTFYRMLAGQLDAPKDTILFANEETRGDKEFFAELLYLPEGFPEYSSRMTVLKQLKRWTHKEQADLYKAALSYLELDKVQDFKLSELSTGGLMRLKLALLIINPALIWLLDRPFYALDAKCQRQLETLIAGRCQQQGIVIFTHEGQTSLNPHHTIDLNDWFIQDAASVS